MQFLVNHSLKPLNSFGFDHRAEHFARPVSETHLSNLVDMARVRRWALFMLGGGSNLVITRDLPGLVVQWASESLQYEPLSAGGCRLTVSAGLGWHALVQDTVNRGWRGLENLALIPGTAGAAPIQNIGAYGVELAEVLEAVRVLHRPSNRLAWVGADDCAFGYRDSLFKRQPDDYIVCALQLRLSRRAALKTDYQSLQAELERRGQDTPTQREVFDAVVQIRRARLPDPAVLGNAGSFFKNPEVEATRYAELQGRWPDLPGYPQASGRVKLAAGWMIDQCGLRGYRHGALGVHEHQALVLVNHGGGTSRGLLDLAAYVRHSVLDKFGLTLEQEPVLV